MDAFLRKSRQEKIRLCSNLHLIYSLVRATRSNKVQCERESEFCVISHRLVRFPKRKKKKETLHKIQEENEKNYIKINRFRV